MLRTFFYLGVIHMRLFRTGRVVLAVILLVSPVTQLLAQKYSPAIDYESVMSTYFDAESGLIVFKEATVIFAPDGKFNGQVVVLDSKNKILGKFDFYKDYKYKRGVYAKAYAKPPAEITLTRPGVYTIVYLVDGKPVTRMPVRLVQTSAGSDPFKPQKKYQFDGYWRTFAYIAMHNSSGNDMLPKVHYWLGGKDLPAGKRRDTTIMTLFRNGKLVAHGKRRGSGTIQSGYFRPQRSSLFFPHTKKESSNARLFMLKDWLVDGKYELRMNRLSDKVLLRSYDFKVVNGKFEPHPRSRLGYQPQTDYIAPRAQNKAGGFATEEVIWIEDRKIE